MHSSRMRTARSLTISHRKNHAGPRKIMHAPQKTTHPPKNHAGAGAHVNKFNAFGQNALQTHIACNESKDIAMLLYIAGETIDCSTVIKYAEDGEIIGQVEVPEYLFRRDLRLRLEHMCREAIRKHLIKVNPHSHLFSRIPQLPLPSALTQYLL